jgi:hypothetical protein
MVLTLVSSGMCGDLRAWEAELARHQVPWVYSGEAIAVAAEDLAERERRTHATAARRYLAAWQALERAYGPVGQTRNNGELLCPELNPSESSNDGLTFGLGLSAGVLAVLHDRSSGGEANVPMDMPRKVERATQCLSDDKLWSMPSALQAAVWATVPGAAPEGKDAFAQLEAAASAGEATGLRLARAFQVQALSTAGREEELRTAIAAAAAAFAITSGPGAQDPSWALLDGYARRLILHESDKRWVAEKGHRTPAGAFGTFPTPSSGSDPGEGLDWEKLLEGQGSEPQAPQVPTAPAVPTAPTLETQK